MFRRRAPLTGKQKQKHLNDIPTVKTVDIITCAFCGVKQERELITRFYYNPKTKKRTVAQTFHYFCNMACKIKWRKLKSTFAKQHHE